MVRTRAGAFRDAGSVHRRVCRGGVPARGGAGTGISAKFEEAGGIDLIVIYNSGRYRMAGRGSLAGLMATMACSCGLKSPISVVSLVSRTEPISDNPICVPESIKPG